MTLQTHQQPSAPTLSHKEAACTPAIAARIRQENIFAANRAASRIALTVKAAGEMTRRARLHEAGSLRVRFPTMEGGELEAVQVNTAGGIAGGDRLATEFTVEPRARLVVTTAAAEKVYRALGPAAELEVKLLVGAGATLAWLPQETILFDGARMRRTIEVELADDARLLLAEALVFGRVGMGEAVVDGQVFDRWRLRRAGRLIHAETLSLDGDIAARLGKPAVANGGIAMATVLIVPGDEAAVSTVRALADQFRGEVGVSAWNGLAAVRLVARDGAALRHDLVAVLTRLRGVRLPRLWLN